jgi:hypothetical protein
MTVRNGVRCGAVLVVLFSFAGSWAGGTDQDAQAAPPPAAAKAKPEPKPGKNKKAAPAKTQAEACQPGTSLKLEPRDPGVCSPAEAAPAAPKVNTVEDIYSPPEGER